MKDSSFLVVNPSSIASSATRGADADLSSDEGSEEVLEDSKDEPIIKTRVSDSNKDSDSGEQEVEAMGMCLSSLLNLFSSSFPTIYLRIPLITLHVILVATDIPKELKPTAGPTMPTSLIFAIIVALPPNGS